VEIDFLNLMPGTYYLGLWAATSGTSHGVLDNVANIDVEPADYYGRGRGLNTREGLVFFPYGWNVPGRLLPGGADASAGPARRWRLFLSPTTTKANT
jgi:hypothetical protein